MKEKLEEIERLLKELPWQSERGARKIEKILAELKEAATLKTVYHTAETIDEKGQYTKYKYRKINRLSFYIRPLREWFIPCVSCQQKLKTMLATGSWILGNKQYLPAIELNTTTNDFDEEYEENIETRKATEEEIKRIGFDGWEEIED